MANVLQQRGQVKILGIMSDIRNTVAVAAIDAIDTAYGHRHIPVGRWPTVRPTRWPPATAGN